MARNAHIPLAWAVTDRRPRRPSPSRRPRRGDDRSGRPCSMRGFIDLHSHWVAGIDDGVKSPADGIALLRGLHAAGFSTVVATPHMRPGMFENDRDALESAF